MFFKKKELSNSVIRAKSRLRDIYVSCRPDTSFETSFRHIKKYLADVLPLVLATQSVYVPKIYFKLFLEQKNFLSFFKIQNI